MAQNNSGAGAVGTIRQACAVSTKSAVLTPASALQLFLKQRQRALQKSTSLDSDPKVALLAKSLLSSLTQPSLKHHRPSSQPRKLKSGDLTNSGIRPLVLVKLANLYRRHRNPERALTLFSLRRQQWRRTRRPFFNMDFINHLRRIQTDEPYSDEDSGAILTSASIPAPRLKLLPSSAPAMPASISTHSDESEVAGAKRKRKSSKEAASAEEASQETPPAAKKAREVQAKADAARAESPKKAKGPTTLPTDGKGPAQANGIKGPRKRARDEDPTTEAEGSGSSSQLASKKVKAEHTSPLRPATTSISAKTAATAESSKSAPAPPAASRIPQKSADKMEYFERRVHDMLTDPLGFDDCVYDTTRPMQQRAARNFARFRRAQKQPPPPLEMSGALGPARGGDGAKTAARAAHRSKGSGGLARDAQKRAHQLKVKGQVENLKGKGVASLREDRERTSFGSGSGKQGGMAKVNGVKRKERAWLTNARQKTGERQGGKHPQARVTKYKKSP